MAKTRWLDARQQKAWRSLLVFVNRGLPEIERTLRSHDLLFVHYGIFVALSAAPDRTMRLSDLAKSANLSQSRLTHRLRTLVERGAVSIDQDPCDGRVKFATLTDDGFSQLEAAAPAHVEDVQRLVFDHLEPAEVECLANALGKVASSLFDYEGFMAEQQGGPGPN
jgi:DNA-binding MarR family transcriptional regulator